MTTQDIPVVVSFRPDARDRAELLALMSDGRSLTQTMRDALHTAYVERVYAQAREEARSIANDPVEQAEIKTIAEFFDEAPWPA